MNWIKKWWPLFVLLLTTIVGVAWLQRRGDSELPDVATEYRAIKAETEAEKLTADLNAAVAAEKVRDTHAEELRELNHAQAKKADALRDDPKALAGHLVRAGAASRRRRKRLPTEA